MYKCVNPYSNWEMTTELQVTGDYVCFQLMPSGKACYHHVLYLPDQGRSTQ